MQVDGPAGVLWLTNTNFMTAADRVQYAESCSRGSRTIFQKCNCAAAMTGVARDVAVAGPRHDIPQIAGAYGVPALRTEKLPEGRPAVHQHEPHLTTAHLHAGSSSGNGSADIAAPRSPGRS